MGSRKRYSLADVRQSYTAQKADTELRSELPVYLVYRPVSFPIAWLCLRAGVPTLLVTLSCGAIALSLPLVAASGGAHAYLHVAGLGVAFHVLDCVDGNMARTTQSTSRWGALLDGLCDFAFWSALLASIGILVERAGVGSVAPFGVELGLASAVALLLARDVRQHYLVLFGEVALHRPKHDEPAPTLAQWLFRIAAGLEHVYVLALAIGGALGALQHVLLAIALYVVGVGVVSTALTLRTAHARERESTRSSTDSTPSKLG